MLPEEPMSVQTNVQQPCRPSVVNPPRRTVLPQGLDRLSFLLRESLRSFMRNRGLDRAAVLAYNTFFALFPLLLLLLFLAGRFMASSQAAMAAVERVAHQLMPVFGEVAIREIRGLATQKTWGLVSLLILVWAVTPLASSIRGAFDGIYRKERGLPFLKEKLLDIMAVLLMLVLLILLVVGELAYAVIVPRLVGNIPLLARFADTVLPVGVTILLLSFIHVVFAPVRAKPGHILAGALLASLLLAAIGPLFAAILRFDPNYGVTFGSLKAVFLLLTWIYSAFAAILMGIELSSNLHRGEALLVRELLSDSDKRDKYVARLSRYVNVLQSGEVLFREGDRGDTMYYVVHGEVQMSRKGRELFTAKAGEYFGEMAMLLNKERTATAIVKAPETRVVRISAENVETVLRENPKVVLALLHEMAERLRVTDEKFDG